MFNYIIVNIFETLLRFLPFPCKPGLIKIGNPNRYSPVFLTCNYHLLTFYHLYQKDFSWGFTFHWGFISLIIIFILSIDLMGSTPLYKSGLHEDRLLRIILDRKKCKGIGFCEQVCPRNCFKVDKSQRFTPVPGSARCIQCGACIIQCPFNALCFKSPKGDIMSPDIIRKYKLNLMGKRLIKIEGK